jgi:hypothetical protein
MSYAGSFAISIRFMLGFNSTPPQAGAFTRASALDGPRTPRGFAPHPILAAGGSRGLAKPCQPP